MMIYSSLDHQQSGNKPNLVAKILATKFGFVPDWSVTNFDEIWNKILNFSLNNINL